MASVPDKELLKKRLNTAVNVLKKKGVSKEDFASRLHVSFGTVQAWLSGRRAPKIPTVKQIESEFGVKII